MDRMANNGTRYRPEASTPVRYTGINITLYGRGEAVAMNYAASTSTKGGAAYLGKDILGSIRSVSNSQAGLEDRYEYDAFGKPYKGDLENGMNLGYTGKPYDSATGMYNYGYRDYRPENARFTTVDPVRDGSNWFAYVNNDPVNYLDPFGLTASDKNSAQTPKDDKLSLTEIVNALMTGWKDGDNGKTLSLNFQDGITYEAKTVLGDLSISSGFFSSSPSFSANTPTSNNPVVTLSAETNGGVHGLFSGGSFIPSEITVTVSVEYHF